MGPASGLGAPERYRVYDGRIYLFASDECRSAFDANPAGYIDRIEPRPAAAPSGQQRAALLLDKALKAMGVIAQAKDIAIVASLPPGAAGSVYVREVTWSAVFPDRLRIERNYEGWGKDADAVSSSEGTYSSPDGMVPHRPAQHAAVLESLRRHPVWLARQWKESGAVAWWAGLTRSGTASLDRVMIWLDGAVSELCIDPAGRIIALSFRDRGPGGRIGWIEHRYSAFKEAGGAILAHHRETSFEGKALPGQTQVVTAVRINSGGK
jgi:YHS domain-containing protein